MHALKAVIRHTSKSNDIHCISTHQNSSSFTKRLFSDLKFHKHVACVASVSFIRAQRRLFFDFKPRENWGERKISGEGETFCARPISRAVENRKSLLYALKNETLATKANKHATLFSQTRHAVQRPQVSQINTPRCSATSSFTIKQATLFSDLKFHN